MVLSSKAGGDTLGSYLVVGDRFRLSQWTASKKAAFQNLSVCLRDETRERSTQVLSSLHTESNSFSSVRVWEA